MEKVLAFLCIGVDMTRTAVIVNAPDEARADIQRDWRSAVDTARALRQSDPANYPDNDAANSYAADLLATQHPEWTITHVQCRVVDKRPIDRWVGF